jgi:hypothetical protein
VDEKVLDEKVVAVERKMLTKCVKESESLTSLNSRPFEMEYETPSAVSGCQSSRIPFVLSFIIPKRSLRSLSACNFLVSRFGRKEL